VELAEAIADLGGSYGFGTMKDFLVNDGTFAACQLRVYIHSLYKQICYRYSS
jgi:hypothetical protein